MASEKPTVIMAESIEKTTAPSTTHAEEKDVHIVKKVHADGHVDLVDAHAIGGNVEDMPKGYFWTPQFIGTVVATCLASMCAYLGWVLPANTLYLLPEIPLCIAT